MDKDGWEEGAGGMLTPGKSPHGAVWNSARRKIGRGASRKAEDLIILFCGTTRGFSQLWRKREWSSPILDYAYSINTIEEGVTMDSLNTKFSPGNTFLWKIISIVGFVTPLPQLFQAKICTKYIHTNTRFGQSRGQQVKEGLCSLSPFF